MTQQMIKNLSQIDVELNDKVSKYEGNSDRNDICFP